MHIHKVDQPKQFNSKANNLIPEQNKIEITEENVDVYKEFISLFNSDKSLHPFNKKNQFILCILLIISVFLGVIPPLVIASILPGDTLGVLIAIITIIPDTYLNVYIIDKIICKLNMKSFQKNTLILILQ